MKIKYQKKYLQKVLERFKMTDCKSRDTSSEHKHEQGSDDLADQKMYREIVGSLIHAMVCTRPDIFWIITKLSLYLYKLLNKHLVAAKQVLRCLKSLSYCESDSSCRDFSCIRSHSSGDYTLHAGCADWASCADDRRSVIF